MSEHERKAMMQRFAGMYERIRHTRLPSRSNEPELGDIWVDLVQFEDYIGGCVLQLSEGRTPDTRELAYETELRDRIAGFVEHTTCSHLIARAHEYEAYLDMLRPIAMAVCDVSHPAGGTPE